VGDQNAGSKFGDLVGKVIVPAVTVLTALLAAWVNYSVSHVKSELDVQRAALDAQKASLDSLTAERSLRRFDEDLTFRIYQAVSDSLKTNDTKQQQAATALVIVLAPEPLRTQLLEVFDRAQTTAPEVRKTVARVLQTEEQYQQEQAVVQPSGPKPPTPKATGAWGEWDVDVFWCERSGEDSKRGAQTIVDALRNEGAKGRLRSRILPDSINAQPGYRMRGYVIRRDPGEEERAQALESLAERALPGAAFQVTPSGQATRSYLSAFVCP
jgi:isocitrate lyase